MKTFADRLRLAMQSASPKKIRSVDLANAIGVKPPSVSDYLSGKTKGMNGDNLVKAAACLGVNAIWLATGKGAMYPDDVVPVTKNSDDSIDLDNPIYVDDLLPVLSWVQAGNWTEVQSIYKDDILGKFPSIPGAGKRSFYLIVKGISNYPYFEDGEYICIDPDYSIDEIQTGKMIVARCNGEATFKALVNEPHKRYLRALNPNWQPNIIELNEDCSFVGKYVGSYRPEKTFL